MVRSPDDLVEALEKAANEAMIADRVEDAMLMHKAAEEIRRLRRAIEPRKVPDDAA